MSHPTPSAAALVTYTFRNGSNHPVRVARDDAGEPLFHVVDLCALLAYVNPHDALRRHVEACDLVKREVTSADPSGRARKTQQANFVTKGGMFALLMASKAPNARAVQRWVTHEVLPSIFKTGRYGYDLTPARHPQSAELLDHNDMGNLSRLVWLVGDQFRFTSAWTQAVWFALRRATGHASPLRFEVRHLGGMAAELRRIWFIKTSLAAAISDAERIAIKRIVRDREDAEAVLAELRTQIIAAAQAEAREAAELVGRWDEPEFVRLIERSAAVHMHPEQLEPPAARPDPAGPADPSDQSDPSRGGRAGP